MLKGLVAWAFGSAVSACTAGEFFNLFSLTSISAIDGILASFVAYIVLVKLSVSNKETVRDFQ
jgi:cytosine permease